MKKQTAGRAIICLQEIHSTERVEKLFEYQWRGKMLFSHGTSGSKGVCVAFRYNLEYQLLNTISDTDGRYIIGCVEIQGQPYILINCYAPNTENGQIQTFKEITNHLVEMIFLLILNTYICAGDWNLIFGATMDSFGKKAKLKRKAIFQLQNIMSSYEIIGIWRTRNPTLRQFTWRRKNPLQMSRADCFLISDDLRHAVKSCKFLCRLSSDHSPVKLTLHFPIYSFILLQL